MIAHSPMRVSSMGKLATFQEPVAIPLVFFRMTAMDPMLRKKTMHEAPERDSWDGDDSCEKLHSLNCGADGHRLKSCPTAKRCFVCKTWPPNALTLMP